MLSPNKQSGAGGSPDGRGARALAAAAARELPWQVALLDAPTGLAVFDRDFRYVQVDETLARLNGLPVGAHLGKTVREVVPEVATLVEPLLEKVLTKRAPTVTLELVGATSDEPGLPHQWLIFFFPVPGADGEPRAVGMLVVDMSSRREAERALRESVSKYRMLVEQAPDPIIIFDEEGNCVDANAQFCETFGYTREDLRTLDARSLVPAEERALLPQRFEALREGKTVRAERRVRRKDGSLATVEVSGTMLDDRRIQSIIRDVSWRAVPAPEPRPGVSPSGVSGSGPAGDAAAAASLVWPRPGDRVTLLRDMAQAIVLAAEVLEKDRAEPGGVAPDVADGVDFYEHVRRVEIDLITRALRRTRGNQRDAARLLNVKHTTLNNMIKRYRIVSQPD